MPASFRNILIPVDFSVNTEVAIKKALEVIEQDGSQIYLFHTQKIIPRAVRMARIVLGKPSYSDRRIVGKVKLNYFQHSITESHRGVKVFVEFKRAKTIETSIIEKANLVKPDVIVIGKHSHHSWFPFLNSVYPNRIAKATGCPVLTVNPDS